VALEIVMPKLGMTMEEGKLLEWKKAEKAAVNKGEIIFVIESDKVTYEVEAQADGLLAILKDADEVYPVGETLGQLAENEGEYDALRAAAADTTKSEKSDTAPVSEVKDKAAAPASKEKAPGGKVRATPGARKLAKKNGVDLSTLTGTGPKGRIQREDVEKAIATASSAPDTTAQTSSAPIDSSAEVIGGKQVARKEKLTGMRSTIARRMLESLQTTAQMTAFAEWDVTSLMALRKQINQDLSKSGAGYKATMPGLMLVLLSRVLKEMPIFNASMQDDTLVFWENVNIGVAVAVPDGLLVPVVHEVEKKSLGTIQLELAGLIDRARTMTLLPDEMSGGTFTLSNLGSYGSGLETVVINPPEVALLGIGRGEKKPVVVDDQIVIREMMPISLTFDHRVIDGATAGAFRNRLKQFVENPGFLITS
jgi:pyruvate dehydrogenase E2 component (dihydrolipoyllysine-residue acetyltransferase)